MFLDEEMPNEKRWTLVLKLKRYLDKLPTYTERIRYCIDTFGELPGSYRIGNGDDIYLPSLPQSDEEKRLYDKALLDSHRKSAINEGDVLGEWSTKTTFKLKLVESFVNKFEDGLRRQHGDFLKILSIEAQLKEIAEAIATAQGTDKNDVTYILIEDLRKSLKVHSPFDPLRFIDSLSSKEKIKEEKLEKLKQPDFFSKRIYKTIRLANVWDVILFERYLTARLSDVREGVSDKISISKASNQIGVLTEQDHLNDSTESPLTEDQLKQPARALYWFYLHEAECVTVFENHPRGKLEAIKELVGKNSWKSFQQHYNNFIDHGNRASISNIKRIEIILPLLLAKCQKAYERASDDLKAARGKVPSKGMKLVWSC